MGVAGPVGLGGSAGRSDDIQVAEGVSADAMGRSVVDALVGKRKGVNCGPSGAPIDAPPYRPFRSGASEFVDHDPELAGREAACGRMHKHSKSGDRGADEPTTFRDAVHGGESGAADAFADGPVAIA